jgi:signal transduction histidine kinase
MFGVALGVALLAWLVGGIVTVGAAREASSRLRDVRLVQMAETVLAFAEHELAEAALDAAGAPEQEGAVHAERRGALDLRYRYQVWNGPRLLLHSPDAPSDRRLAPMHESGFGQALVQGERLRTFVHRAATRGLEVQVAEVLSEEEGRLMLPGAGVVLLMSASIGAVVLLAGWLVLRTLRPVAAAEQELRQRRPHDLRPLQAPDLPREMQPLLTALNEHLHRAAQRLSRERGFTALAAHELRTPLAALRMQAQVAQRETDPARRGQQLTAVMSSVDRCDHLVEQLLTLARLEQAEPAASATDIELAPLCEQILDDLAPALARQGTQVRLDLQAPRLRGRPFAIHMLLRNLVANAVAYTPPQGRLVISSAAGADRLVLTVDDTGPGIPAADRERVFERFVRLDRSGSPQGVGLGLAIVRTVADEHGASVELLDAPLGGLRVRVSFPQAAGPADSPGPAP